MFTFNFLTFVTRFHYILMKKKTLVRVYQANKTQVQQSDSKNLMACCNFKNKTVNLMKCLFHNFYFKRDLYWPPFKCNSLDNTINIDFLSRIVGQK